ncbi:FAD-dependent oxidoreductase, partial [Nonomuraea sp. RK-328]|nr:FAD-dependent oxidoreductase [Nonomuraea sp. RK-328]
LGPRRPWSPAASPHGVLDHLPPRLSHHALAVLRSRGVEVRLGTLVDRLTRDTAHLSDGTTVPCRLLVWTAGVTGSPLIEELGLPVDRGRLTVGADLAVPGRPDVFALGDAAAVPDLGRPGSIWPQTAQH